MEKIFVTGGAGFLGRAILRSLGGDFTIYSRDEAKHARVRQEFPKARFILGDVRDYDRLEMAMAGHDKVIHAAAFKYVPQAETNVAEAVAVNVDGSRNVAKAAVRNGIARVVGISTDKACKPINVYGMTKLMMERIFQEADSLSDTRFNIVRYGNVVSSTGSVIPIFQAQIKRSKIITVTHPEMTRFWLSVREAVELIINALLEPQGGTILIPRLPSLSMNDLAKAVVSLNGATNVTITTIGQRFGEKMHEDLLTPEEIIYTEQAWQGAMRMYPVAQGAIDSHVWHPYNSGDPDKWLAVEDMATMIREAPE